MPKGDKSAACKSPGKQETDAETRAIACLVEAMDKHSLLEANKKTTDAHPTPSDGEHCRGERFAIYIEVERHRGLATLLMDKAVPTYTWTKQIIKDHLGRDILEMMQLVILSPTACIVFKRR